MSHRLLISLFVACILSVPSKVYAQLEADNWVYDYFVSSRSGGFVSFNKATSPFFITYPPTADSGALGGVGVASYSSKDGDLLFAVLGLTVYDKNFRVMPGLNPSEGGTLLKGTHSGSLSQPILCVPYPGRDSLYIIFHIFYDFVNGYRSQLFYSIINMNRRNGLGDVEPGQINIPLLPGQDVAYKLTAVKHCNNKDLWITGHLSNSDKYYSLLITPSGVNTTPVFFSGNHIPEVRILNNRTVPNNYGCIKIAPLGNRLAAAMMGQNFVELFDFDNSTGIGSNLKKLQIQLAPSDTNTVWTTEWRTGVWGVEFSPSGDKLYVSSNYQLRVFIDNEYTPMLHQFDVSLPTEAQVQASQYEVDRLLGEAQGGALQLANNGKIYFNVLGSLCEIASPESAGSSCNFTRFVARTNFIDNQNLPSYIQSYFKYPIIVSNDCISLAVDFSLGNSSGITNVFWDFGDTASGMSNSSTMLNPNHTFSHSGIYKVSVIISNGNTCVPDTIVRYVNAGKLTVDLGRDTTFCTGDSIFLKVGIPGAVAQWSNGVSGSQINLKEPGTYSVKVFFGSCVASDTIQISEKGLPRFSLGDDTAICSNDFLTLSPLPLYNTALYLWSSGSAGTNITTNNPGNYFLTITDSNGCKYSDSISVDVKSLPGYSIGSDTSICENKTIALQAMVGNADTFLWNTGSILPSIEIIDQGWYWCDVTKAGCKYRDSMYLIVKPQPIVKLGADTILCEGERLQLNAFNTSAEYIWQDNSTNYLYEVASPGIYSVEVSMNGCTRKDTINIDYKLSPRFDLGSDQVICSGQSIILKPVIDTAWELHWQDGSTDPSYAVSRPGVYFLEARNECGVTKEEVFFSEGLCNVYVPQAFTPNADTRNDLFKVSGTALMNFFRMQIYNRYGQLVFETTDKNKAWDGVYKNKACEAGAYVYRVEYKDNRSSTTKFLKGSFLLLR